MPLPFPFNWKNLDYISVFDWRWENLQRIRAAPNKEHVLQQMGDYYADHPAQFMIDWGMTANPRNVDIDLLAAVPFLLYPRENSDHRPSDGLRFAELTCPPTGWRAAYRVARPVWDSIHLVRDGDRLRALAGTKRLAVFQVRERARRACGETSRVSNPSDERRRTKGGSSY
jgi:hypothetical protein